MALTKCEQQVFEDMFWEISDIHPDTMFMDRLADLIFEMTGNVNLRMRLFAIAQKLSGSEFRKKR